MPHARDGGTAQGKYDVVWLVFIYPESSHHPLRAVFSAVSNKAYGYCFIFDLDTFMKLRYI